MTTPHPPERIELGDYTLRRNVPADGAAVAAAVARNLEHLRRWMPWATPEAATEEFQRRRIADLPAWSDGNDYSYLLLDGAGEVVGGFGMHRRIGPGAIEIGYWLAEDVQGLGLATRAAGALTTAAWGLADVDRVEIHADEANRRSQAVPARLGYHLARVIDDEPKAPADTGRLTIWTRDRGPAPDDYIRHIHDAGTALLDAVRSAPVAPVRACPGWDNTDLLRHTAVVHHWVANIIRTGATQRPDREYSPTAPETIDHVATWYQAGLDELLAELEATDPGTPVWNWFDDHVAPARFWHRRMAHETAVHRWDAEHAAGQPGPIDAALALDGIDEYLPFAASDVREDGIDASGSLALVPHGSPGWYLDMDHRRLTLRGRAGPTDATVRGTASDVLLWMLHRDVHPALDGDAGAWNAIVFS